MFLDVGIDELVTTLRVVWIEMVWIHCIPLVFIVTTLRVVWIEIKAQLGNNNHPRSPPCGWCGLKYI